MCFCSVPETIQSGCLTGDVRLVGNEVGDKGRLEICINDAWGTVCGDGFDSNEARVACHSLGGYSINGESILLPTCQHVCKLYTELCRFVAESEPVISGYDEGDGPIFLSLLECSGDEQSLMDCPAGRPIGLHQCDHTADIALHCLGIL